MKKIPPALREDMANDPFYKNCCLEYFGGCRGRIQWHHQIIYAGSQLNQKWAIVPACEHHHDRVVDFKDDFMRIALSRATDAELHAISKAIDYRKMRDDLVYGEN